MIEIPNTAKSEYKEDSVVKSMLVAFRDLGVMLTDSNIVQESETVTESICSAGSFKVGLCEASQGAISVNLTPNVEGDEMTLIQTLGYFEPTVTVDNTKGIVLSGDGVTLAAEQEIGTLPEEEEEEGGTSVIPNTGSGENDEPTVNEPIEAPGPGGIVVGDDETLLVEYGGTQETDYYYPDSVELRATYTDGDLSVIETQHLGNETGDVSTTLDETKHVYPVRVSGTADYAVQGESRLVGQKSFSLDNSGTGDFSGNVPRYYKEPSTVDITGHFTVDGQDVTEVHRVYYNPTTGKANYTFPERTVAYEQSVYVRAFYSNGAYKDYTYSNPYGPVTVNVDGSISGLAYAASISVTAYYYQYSDGTGDVTTQTTTYTNSGGDFDTQIWGGWNNKYLKKIVASVTWSNGSTSTITKDSIRVSYYSTYELTIEQKSVSYNFTSCNYTVNWVGGGQSTEEGITKKNFNINGIYRYFNYWEAFIYWSDGNNEWNPHRWGGLTFECGVIELPLTHYKGKVLWSNGHESDIEVGDGYNYQSYAISIADRNISFTSWEASVHWTDGTIATLQGNTTTILIEKRTYTKYISAYFEADKYYLMLAKIKYTGDSYIYLYVQDNRGKARTVYFLDKNQILPGEYIQVAIPFVGLDFKDYGCAVYGKYDPENGYERLEGYAQMYIIDCPIMPLGLFGITSCRKRNDGMIRDLQGYDRMKDTNLSEDVHYNFTNVATVQIGVDVLDPAASQTQIIIGSNLSKDPVQLVAGTPTTQQLGANEGFPTGVIYAADRVNQETASGSVDRTIAGGRFAYTEWTTREATVQTSTRESNQRLSGIPDSWFDSTGFDSDLYQYSEYGPVFINRMHFPHSGEYEILQPEENYYRVNTRTEIIVPTTPSGYTLYSISGLTYTYYKNTRYDFRFNSKYASDGWYIAEETLNGCSAYSTQPVEATSAGTCTRVYRQVISQKSWSVTCIGTTVEYTIPNYGDDPDLKYSIYTYSPEEYGAYIAEDLNVRQAYVEPYLAEGAVIRTDQQAALRRAIFNWSTHDPIVVNDGSQVAADKGKFTVRYVSQIIYSGSDQGSVACGNLLRGVSTSSVREKFDEWALAVLNEEIHTTRRAVISSYLEMNGLFIRFDRYGVSNLFSVRMNALYPAEDLYPHDSTEYPQYGDIYPMEGSNEVAAASLCKEIYVSDKINRQFDGIKISGNGQWTDANNVDHQFPFYYNRMDRVYGELPAGMPETSTTPWPTNYYYEVTDNFFFNNFKWTITQLKEVCKTMIENIGSLQYFNMTAQLKALPYLEAGDSISVLTPRGGYDTAILRRTMKGCSAMMDTIETEFYK